VSLIVTTDGEVVDVEAEGEFLVAISIEDVPQLIKDLQKIEREYDL
jgi:hypothetical protein